MSLKELTNKNINEKEKFDILLFALHTNQDHAANLYENLRKRLCLLFSARNLLNIEEYADVVFDRVNQKLVLKENGDLFYKKQTGLEVLDRKEFPGYIIRVAQLVAKEKIKSEIKAENIDWQSNSIEPSYDPIEKFKEKEAEIEASIKIEVQKRCLDELEKDDREMLIVYTFIGERSKSANEKREKREKLADKLGLTVSNLRTKISRLREKLENCLKKMMISRNLL